MSTYEARVIEAALRAARKALRDLDDDQIPASLRPVAASAARRLPPPLAGALIRDLDRFEWLRRKAVEAWPGIDEAPQADAASAAFLLRPDGWEKTISSAGSERSERDLATRVEMLEKQVTDLQYQLGVEKERVDKARADLAEAERQARRQSGELGRKVHEASGAERASRLAAESTLRELEPQLEQARADLAEADDRVAFLRDELLRARRSSPGERDETRPDVWSSRSPAELATLLDQVMAHATPDAVPDEMLTDAPALGLTLPVGIRPDAGAAIDWLLEQGEPFVMIVDGYNVAHRWSPPLSREDLNHRLARVRRLATAPVRLEVVYDSTLSGGGQSGRGPGGIDIHFTQRGVIADEEIIDRASRTEGNVVVVSSDREVREGASNALCLWGQAVEEWFRR